MAHFLEYSWILINTKFSNYGTGNMSVKVSVQGQGQDKDDLRPSVTGINL
jgi:hypothetical protein